MSVAMHMKWAGVTPEQYNKVRELTEQDNSHPKGGLFHAVWFDGSGIRITDVWESADDFNNFVQTRLMKATAEAGIQGQPEVEIHPLHTMAPYGLMRWTK